MDKVMDYYGIDEGIFSCARRNVCDSECLDDSYSMCQTNPSKCKKMKKTMTCIPGSEPDYMGRPVCVCDPAQGYMPPLEGNHKFKGCEGISQPIGGKRGDQTCKLDFASTSVAAGEPTKLTFTFKLYSVLSKGESISWALPGFQSANGGNYFDEDALVSFQVDEAFFSRPHAHLREEYLTLGLPMAAGDNAGWAPDRPLWVMIGSADIYRDLMQVRLENQACFVDAGNTV